ncbi:glycosyltransferase family 2 protein [Leptotrichia buccalis]|uniref:Glycosyl transferase family 2 n=1 Tax=Leptotrichia buccalis (strain ATCC 14201 / DSM 1135 / JCM 12969 / NCTC 10249 / C-1013-b) TaxID=523794 RepID=C7NBG2_LEPBD|nr:glycosyltransferase family 2 protein [Leptotrichia buccalis]ACV39493.1 glycosyl transferase family 2 [Leptotrichia buccalis C-1013-b]
MEKEKEIEKEKVSIIVPMYNAEKFIGKTIESVLAQTYQNWEMLIMNDVSTDNSLAIVSLYAKKDERIKIVNTEKNVGVVKGRNFLIDLASGKYIAFLDADDYWHNEKLEKQIKFMKEKNASISCTEYTRVKENEEKINDVIIKEEISYNDMLKNNYLGCLTVIYDAKKIGKRYFKELEKNEDYVLWLEIVKDVNTIYGLKENLAYYRVLDNSRSSNKVKTAKVRWEIYRKIEKLSLLKSLYYFLHYAIRAVLKNG